MSQHFKVWKITLLLLLGLFAFLYIGANTVADIYTLGDPELGMSSMRHSDGQVYVDQVIPRGPAAQKGIRVGDRILALNDIPLSEKGAFLGFLRSLDLTREVRINIARGEAKLDFVVPLEKKVHVYARYVITSLLPAILFCYTLFIIGIFVFLKKITDRTAHVFYAMVTLWALAMWDTFPGSLNTIQKLLPEWYDWLIKPFWPFAIGLLLHFTLLFPLENKTFKRYPVLVLCLVYSPVLLVFPFIYADIYDLAWENNILRYGWGAMFSVSFGLAIHFLGRCKTRGEDPHVVRQAQIMYWGTLLFVAIPTGYYFLPKSFFVEAALPYSEYFLFIMVLWPATLAYAVIKHRFMEIDVIIKRGVAYALLSGFVVAAYFLLVVGAGKLILKLTDSDNQLVTILATLCIAALFNPVKNRIQIFVNRRFFPNRFRYRESVRDFRHQLVNIVDPQKLFDTLLSFLAETMQITSIVVFWKNETSGEFEIRTSLGNKSNLATEVFSGDDRVLRDLQAKKQLLDMAPLFKEPHLLSDEESEKWGKFNAELVNPLFFKGNLIGFIILGAKKGDEPYYNEDIEVLEALGDQVNISLENALLTEELREQDRLKKELEVARRIQLSSLPQSDPVVQGLDISGISIPAMEVGGDYYDYFNFSDGRFGVVVGDVSGKGTSAALYMSQLRGVLKTAAKFHKSLKALITEVNVVTSGSMEERSFITLSCGAFDVKSKKMSLVRAGHLPLIHFSAAKGTCTQLTPRGIGIGLEKGDLFEKEIEEVVLPYATDDVFLFYSDGIAEAQNDEKIEFEATLSELVKENGCETAVVLRQRIIDRVQSFAAGTPQKDDMTLVVVKAT